MEPSTIAKAAHKLEVMELEQFQIGGEAVLRRKKKVLKGRIDR